MQAEMSKIWGDIESAFHTFETKILPVLEADIPKIIALIDTILAALPPTSQAALLAQLPATIVSLAKDVAAVTTALQSKAST